MLQPDKYYNDNVRGARKKFLVDACSALRVDNIFACMTAAERPFREPHRPPCNTPLSVLYAAPLICLVRILFGFLCSLLHFGNFYAQQTQLSLAAR